MPGVVTDRLCSAANLSAIDAMHTSLIACEVVYA
jgi:hypothetical protein